MKKLSIYAGLVALALSTATACGGYKRSPGPTYLAKTHAVAPH